MYWMGPTTVDVFTPLELFRLLSPHTFWYFYEIGQHKGNSHMNQKLTLCLKNNSLKSVVFICILGYAETEMFARFTLQNR